MRIIGSFSGSEPLVDIILAPGRSIKSVKALIDTGFTGFVCIPPDYAYELEFTPDGEKPVVLANGAEVVMHYCLGEVNIAGSRYLGEIGWIEESEDSGILIGYELLDAADVIIDYEKKEIRVP